MSQIIIYIGVYRMFQDFCAYVVEFLSRNFFSEAGHSSQGRLRDYGRKVNTLTQRKQTPPLGL